jgi:hypothetical protein
VIVYFSVSLKQVHPPTKVGTKFCVEKYIPINLYTCLVPPCLFMPIYVLIGPILHPQPN